MITIATPAATSPQGTQYNYTITQLHNYTITQLHNYTITQLHNYTPNIMWTYEVFIYRRGDVQLYAG